MLKITALLLATISFLYAVEPTEAELNSIYTEAILFVAVFGIMGIISFIYSKKHAKEYVAPKKIIKLTAYQLACKKRVDELKEMLGNKLIKEDEFEVLKKYYKVY